MIKLTCNICSKEGNKEFYTQTMTYYRNKASGHYYFCSNDCKTIFCNTKKCKYCGYYSDLLPIDEGFMLCTSDEYWNPSCYDKYFIRKQFKIDKEEAIKQGFTVDNLYDNIGNNTIAIDECESDERLIYETSKYLIHNLIYRNWLVIDYNIRDKRLNMRILNNLDNKIEKITCYLEWENDGPDYVVHIKDYKEI